ncbi:MAG TPA: FAD-dependent oxidoreductase [Rhodanobacteraceae bacterium]|nr:FAD-dependent oxidoreductase [Rhodanobacteraceae bacterium]
MISPRDDVLILGGGVIGLSCALALRRAGASVRVLEQASPGAGASHGNCGTLTPSHAIPLSVPGVRWKALRWMLKRDAPLYVNPRPDFDRWRWLLGFARRCRLDHAQRAALARCAILQRSHALLPQWLAEEGIDCDYAKRGTLYVYHDARALWADRADVDWLHELGLTADVLDPATVLGMEPALKPGVTGGVLHPDDAQLRPDRLVDGLARRVLERGVAIETGARIEGFDCADGKINAVRTSRGGFSGERIVLALGAWSPAIAKHLGMQLPMQPGKGYSITTSRPDPCPRTALVLREAGVCVTAWESGFRLGSTMEFSGYDTTLNRTRLDALRRGAQAYLRAPFGGELREEWWGWRPMCVDEVPIIGASMRWNNLVLATGHGMLGVSMSAATGELVAAQVTGARTMIDPAPYSPARFGL